MKLKAVIFDLDDTLVHGYDERAAAPIDLHFLSWRAVLGELGIEFTAEFHDTRMKGKTNAACEEILHRALGCEPGIAIAERKEAYYRRTLVPEYLRLFDGADTLLDALRDADVALGVLTNAPRGNVVAARDKVGLSAWLDPGSVVCADDLDDVGLAPKPAPDGLYHLASMLGVTVGQVLYVGDSRPDMQAAAGAGVPSLGKHTSLSREALLDLGAADTFESYRELSVKRLTEIVASRTAPA